VTSVGDSSAAPEVVVGIDLGTTNSEIAAFVDGRVRVLGPEGRTILPSCVGISPAGQLLVGASARNQALLYPERTIRSIKRRMGSAESVALGDRSLKPEEVSALILRELVTCAERQLGTPVRKAVITVPAYFNDAQRTATRLAGELAGLEVIRILNEPTAASLAYGAGESDRRTVLVYDLGGGTFDVSVVETEGDVTEVLASHGNTQLGGDDFDELLARRLMATFKASTGVDLAAGPATARARLWAAAEDAKKNLSSEPFVRVLEESLVEKEGRPLHMQHELSREELEELVRPLVDSTLESVWKALQDAKKDVAQIDDVLLVGGATRMPLVSRTLAAVFGRAPSQAVHPDLCVALGAGVLASRLAGRAVERVLVDVSPYSFGPSYLGERDGYEYPYCYHPVIPRNTPLPVTRTERYFTASSGQTAVDLQIFQGDDPDALNNIPVGQFRIDQLTPSDEPSEVLCRMAIDLDGILQVTAIEKRTGRSAHITIKNALRERSEREVAEARARVAELLSRRGDSADALVEDDDEEHDAELDLAQDRDDGEAAPAPAGASSVAGETADAADNRVSAEALLERSRALLDSMHPDDREEAVELNLALVAALEGPDVAELQRAATALKDLLFFVEGRA
jgi:molecular chaperone DnaK (HSP70)